MKTTGLFTVHKFVIPFTQYNKTIKIVPFSDVHRFAPLHAEKVWYKFLDRYRNDKSAYFIGGGDYLDEISSTERKSYINANYHDSTIQNLDKFYLQRAKNLAKELSFMKGRLIGLCEGNHYFQLSTGLNTNQILCQELGCRNLGVKTFVELIFKKDEHHTNRLVLCYHHGEGGGRRASSSVAKLENMAHTHGADLVLQGHDHRKNHIEITEIGITDTRGYLPTEIQRTKFCARTGGFLKGYINNCMSYVADNNMPPNSLGNVEFHVTPRRLRNKIPILRDGQEKTKDGSFNKKTIDKRWLTVEFHSCNYAEH